MNTKGAAMRYYPDLGYVAAVRRFRQEIRDTQGLHDALIGMGYEERHRYLCPQQMSVIEDFLRQFGIILEQC